MLIRDCMASSEAGLAAETPVRQALQRMVEEDVCTLPVVDQGHHLLGSVSAANLWSSLSGSRATPEETKIQDLTLPQAQSLAAGDPIEAAASLLLGSPLTDALPVIEGGEVVGILTRHDLLQTMGRSPGPQGEELSFGPLAHTAAVPAYDWGWEPGVADPSIYLG